MQRSHFFRWPILALASLIGILSQSAIAAEAPRWYEIELALISYQDSQKIAKESWPEILVDSSSTLMEMDNNKPKNPWQWVSWWNTTAQPILDTPFATLGMAFEDKADKFEKNKDLKIVWSKKWRQPIPEKADALLEENLIEIDLKTALNFNNAIKHHTPLIEIEVSGSMYFYRSRFLHLITDLTVQHWQSIETNSETEQTMKVRPNHATGNQHIVPSRYSSPVTAFDSVPLRAAKIEQSRRMRSNELHYIDHPLLGILVRIIPLEE